MTLFKKSLFVYVLLFSSFLFAQDENSEQQKEDETPSVMTNDRLGLIISRIDPEFTGTDGLWQFHVQGTEVQVITDTRADRMRIIVPIREADEIEPEELYRLLQANFDAALDARYAIGRGILWSSFVHPLSSLNDRDFLSGLGQTVNTATSYGSTYSSGVFTFGGGDSGELIEKELIEELLNRGQII